jgi:urease accessory protein
VLAESVRLGGGITGKLAQRDVTAGGRALATVLVAPGEARHVEAVRAQNFSGEVGISAWNGIAVARLVAPDAVALRRDLAAVLAALAMGPLPRLWVN